MNKNIIIITISTLFLVASIIYTFAQRKNFDNVLKETKENYAQIEYIAQLKELWGAKGIKSKLTKISNSIPANKKERFLVKRSKADISFKKLNEKELNRVLSKLAMLPIQFKQLKVARSGDNFSLECLCVW